MTRLADSPNEKLIPITALEFSSLITVPNVPKVGSFAFAIALSCALKGEDLSKFVNFNSRHQADFLGASTLASLKLGDIIQINRKGYFICDQVGMYACLTALQLRTIGLPRAAAASPGAHQHP